MTPNLELKSLQRSVRELETRFLEKHLKKQPLGTPKRGEILDVAAFVVLTHGALENFVEGVALWVLGRVEVNWTSRRRATRATAALLFYQKNPALPSAPLTMFDQIRNGLSTSKTSHSASISDNNGIAPKNLRLLFYPLGVNVPSNPVLTASLETIVKMRHEWAHQSRFGAKVVKSAKDTKIAVADCLKFATELSREASKVV